MPRLLPAIAALTIATPLAADPPRVVADIPPIHSLVAQVMQGVGEPDLLIPATSSPHDYALRPSDAGALSAADLVVTVGPGLTPWLEGPLDSLAEDAHRLVLMDTSGMTLLDFREGAWFAAHDHDDDDHDDHDHAKEDENASDEHDHDHAKEEEHAHDDHDHDHAKEEEHAHDDHDHDHAKEEEHAHGDHDDHAGHDHGEGHDPHIWLDPFNAAIALGAIAEELSELDPENAATYASNAAAAQENLDTLIGQIEAKLAPAKGKGFLVFHDAYHYFEARFDIEASGSVNPGDAASAGAARIAELRADVGENAVTCAFSEPQMNQSLLQTVVEGQDVRLAVLDPLGVELAPGPALYGELLAGLATAMGDCLTQ